MKFDKFLRRICGKPLQKTCFNWAKTHIDESVALVKKPFLQISEKLFDVGKKEKYVGFI